MAEYKNILMHVDEIDYSKLDEGIRDLVQVLNEGGS